MPPEEALPLVRQAAERALALDSSLAEARVALGSAHLQTAQYSEAEEEFRDAIRLDPRYPTAHQWYGTLLEATHRTQDAIHEYSQARDLDPLSPIISANLGVSLALGGRREEAITAMGRALELAPSVGAIRMNASKMWEILGEVDSSLAQIRETVRLVPGHPAPLAMLALRAMNHRRFPEAAAAADRAMAGFPDNANGYVLKANLLLSSGNQAGARTILANLIRRIPRPPIDAYLLFPLVGGGYAAEFERLPLASANAVSRLDTFGFYGSKAIWMRGRGHTERARATFDTLLNALETGSAGPESEPVHLPYRTIAFAGLGRREEARQALRALLDLGQRLESEGDRVTAGAMSYHAACVYMLMGDAGAAVGQLQRWLTFPTGGTLAYLRIDPTFAPLRDDPSFRRLVGEP